MKTITLTRHELVWQTRVNSWGESDWNHLLKWMKGVVDSATSGGYYKKRYTNAYNVIKDLTWEQAVAEFNKEYDSISWENDNSYTLSTGEEVKSSYKETLYELLCEHMREDNYNQDVSDENYADDFEEDFYVSDDEE